MLSKIATSASPRESRAVLMIFKSLITLYNSRDIHDGFRFKLSLRQLEGRLSYKQLVNGNRADKEETTNKAN
jgi:hypothetical protein